MGIIRVEKSGLGVREGREGTWSPVHGLAGAANSEGGLPYLTFKYREGEG